MVGPLSQVANRQRFKIDISITELSQLHRLFFPLSFFLITGHTQPINVYVSILEDIILRNKSRVVVLYDYPGGVRMLMNAIEFLNLQGRLLFVIAECVTDYTFLPHVKQLEGECTL